MNNKGYMTVGLLIVILFFSLLYLTIFYVSTANTSKIVAKSSETNHEVVKDKNGTERLYSLLKGNVSYVGDVKYDDLERSYTLKTLAEQFENVEMTFQSTSSFHVNNRTAIDLDVRAHRLNNDFDYSYDVELFHNGIDLLLGEGIGMTGNYLKTVEETLIYNLETHETRYGEFQLKFSNLSNVTIESKVNFNELVKRELSIKGQGLNREIIIENDGEFIVKFKKGGS